MKLLITGGLGFIGINFLNQFSDKFDEILVLDKFSYCSQKPEDHAFLKKRKIKVIKADVSKENNLNDCLKDFFPQIVLHLAAETHVDNSIANSRPFIDSNIIGTYNLLNFFNTSLKHKKTLKNFINVSTDEVYGSLGADGYFNESSPYSPNSPYSASKASSDQIANAFNKTYGLPVTITNCSNNFGKFQHTEKLIPKTIKSILNQQKMTVYGNGQNVRDWIYVGDHCNALYKVIDQDLVNERLCIGGDNELSNIDVIKEILQLMQHTKNINESLVFIKDRLGHDQRYAIDSQKIKKLTGWKPSCSFRKNLQETIDWYKSSHNG